MPGSTTSVLRPTNVLSNLGDANDFSQILGNLAALNRVTDEPDYDEDAERGLVALLETARAEATMAPVQPRIETATTADQPHRGQRGPRRRLLGVSAVRVALAAAAAVAVFLTLRSSRVTPGVENATAAIKKPATLTAASADHSGTATVRMTHDGRLWALKVVRWNGNDLALTDNTPGQPEPGLPLLFVNGVIYGHDPAHKGWVEIGPVSSIVPGSGTMPTDILAAVREDMGEATLRRITATMTARGLTSTHRSDGSTVYRGTVPAGQIGHGKKPPEIFSSCSSEISPSTPAAFFIAGRSSGPTS